MELPKRRKCYHRLSVSTEWAAEDVTCGPWYYVTISMSHIVQVWTWSCEYKLLDTLNLLIIWFSRVNSTDGYQFFPSFKMEQGASVTQTCNFPFLLLRFVFCFREIT